MGFFFVENKPADKHLKGLSPDFLRRHECQVCPLNEAKLNTPKMFPSGSKNPEVLVLGEWPTALDDSSGKHFAGKSGKLIKDKIPAERLRKVRWSNVINCHVSGDIPDNVAQQCCSVRLEKDIAAHKPKAIFGIGAVPLFALTKQSGIAIWRNRRIPITVGGHTCWYYPMLHTGQLYRKNKYKEFALDEEQHFAFELDFKRAFAELDNLPAPVVHTLEDVTADIELLYDLNTIAERLNEVANDVSCGIDIETNGLRPYAMGAKILSIAFSGKERTFAFGVDHPKTNWTKLERQQLDVLIKRFLYEATCKRIVHHLHFELEWFGFFYGVGCLYAGRWEDSESAAYILDARRGGLSLDFLCFQYFGFNLKAISGLDRKNLAKSPLREVLKYNAIDARYHRLLWLAEWVRIKLERLQAVYRHQIRRIPSLVLGQLQGVPVDQTTVNALRKKYTKRANAAAEAIANDESVIEYEKQKGKKFNPSSSHDVNYLLKEIVGVDLATTAKGELANVEHPIAKKIVEWREPNKVLSTYIESIAEGSETTNLFPDGRLHPIIGTTRVITWRTSSDSPNIQNWSKHNEELKEVRSQIADPDLVVVSVDYSGIQARNVAMESKDKKLVDAYWHNYDIHADWRDRILRKYPKWIPKAKWNDKDTMKAHRQIAKNKFVFATFFGAQSYTTSEGLKVPQNICDELREDFFDEFPDIHKWHKNLNKMYHEKGYVTGLSGFRRYAPVSVNELINTPIQSDESIIVMDAMIRLSELQDPRYQPALMVHDDLTFFWPKKEVEKRLEVVVGEMVNCPFEWTKIVPIEVEVSMGPNWIDMKEIGKFSSDKWNGIVEIKSV